MHTFLLLGDRSNRPQKTGRLPDGGKNFRAFLRQIPQERTNFTEVFVEAPKNDKGFVAAAPKGAEKSRQQFLKKNLIIGNESQWSESTLPTPVDTSKKSLFFSGADRDDVSVRSAIDPSEDPERASFTNDQSVLNVSQDNNQLSLLKPHEEAEVLISDIENLYAEKNKKMELSGDEHTLVITDSMLQKLPQLWPTDTGVRHISKEEVVFSQMLHILPSGTNLSIRKVLVHIGKDDLAEMSTEGMQYRRAKAKEMIRKMILTFPDAIILISGILPNRNDKNSANRNDKNEKQRSDLNEMLEDLACQFDSDKVFYVCFEKILLDESGKTEVAFYRSLNILTHKALERMAAAIRKELQNPGSFNESLSHFSREATETDLVHFESKIIRNRGFGYQAFAAAVKTKREFRDLHMEIHRRYLSTAKHILHYLIIFGSDGKIEHQVAYRDELNRELFEDFIDSLQYQQQLKDVAIFIVIIKDPTSHTENEKDHFIYIEQAVLSALKKGDFLLEQAIQNFDLWLKCSLTNVEVPDEISNEVYKQAVLNGIERQHKIHFMYCGRYVSEVKYQHHDNSLLIHVRDKSVKELLLKPGTLYLDKISGGAREFPLVDYACCDNAKTILVKIGDVFPTVENSELKAWLTPFFEINGDVHGSGYYRHCSVKHVHKHMDRWCTFEAKDPRKVDKTFTTKIRIEYEGQPKSTATNE